MSPVCSTDPAEAAPPACSAGATDAALPACPIGEAKEFSRDADVASAGEAARLSACPVGTAEDMSPVCSTDTAEAALPACPAGATEDASPACSTGAASESVASGAGNVPGCERATSGPCAGAASARGAKRGTNVSPALAGAFHEESGRAHTPSPLGVSGQG